LSDVDQKMQRIKELHEKKGELLDELEGALALKKLWPGIFDHGRIKCHVEGSLNYPKKVKLVAIDGAGTRREILLKDAPRVIRDVHVPLYGKEHLPFVLFFQRLNKKEDEDRAKEEAAAQSEGPGACGDVPNHDQGDGPMPW
jgi:hypothetical protein